MLECLEVQLFISFLALQASSERRLGACEPVYSDVIITGGSRGGAARLVLLISLLGRKTSLCDGWGSWPDQSTSSCYPECIHTPPANTTYKTTSKCQNVCIDVHLNSGRSRCKYSPWTVSFSQAKMVKETAYFFYIQGVVELMLYQYCYIANLIS